jgi:hypothetical protein
MWNKDMMEVWHYMESMEVTQPNRVH